MTRPKIRWRPTGGLAAAAALAGLLFAPSSASAVQTIIESDTYLSSASNSAKNQNFGNAVSLRVASNLTSFMRFDFSALPPGTTGANVQKATLGFFVSSVSTPRILRRESHQR